MIEQFRGLLEAIGNRANQVGEALPQLQGNPAFNLGVGLLAAGGRRPGQRVSFGQGLLEAQDYASRKQADFQTLEANRMALEQATKQRQAQQGLLDLMNASNIPPSIRRPGLLEQQQRQMIPLLAAADPQGFTQAMTTSLLTPTDPSQEIADTLNAIKAQDLFETREEDREERERTERRDNQSRKDIVSEVSKLTNLLELTGDTEVQTGAFSQAYNTKTEFVNAIKELVGLEASKTEKLAGQFDLMNKGFERLLTGLIPEGTTNLGLRRLMGSNAGVTLTPAANAKLLFDALDGVISDHFIEYGDTNDLDVDSIREIQKRLKVIIDEGGVFGSGSSTEATSSSTGSAELPPGFRAE